GSVGRPRRGRARGGGGGAGRRTGARGRASRAPPRAAARRRGATTSAHSAGSHSSLFWASPRRRAERRPPLRQFFDGASVGVAGRECQGCASVRSACATAAARVKSWFPPLPKFTTV